MNKFGRIAVVAAATIGVLAIAAPASAHVTVNPREATQGGYARLDFRVPNESDTDTTTKLEIYLPEDAPVASVSTMPLPGWTVEVTRRTLDTPVEVHGNPVSEVVSVLTWTATADAAIKPGQFQEFGVSIGPLPEVDRMVFKALQTYSDGTVVRWIDVPEGNEEPEHPAPILTLTANTTTEPTTTEPATTEPALTSASTSNTPTWLAATALLTAAAALLLSLVALSRRPPPSR